LLWLKNVWLFKRSYRDKEDTHNSPAPAGPAALKSDIRVIEMPLAAPL